MIGWPTRKNWRRVIAAIAILSFLAIEVAGQPTATPRACGLEKSRTGSGCGVVKLRGNSLEDDGGPFLGLGATYMAALRLCKYDRNRMLGDLEFLSSKGFNYIRILSMVGWAGKEIAPISLQEKTVPAWPDYWDQFRDLIDIAYDQFGMRTQITIFADAQLCMPNKSDRIDHLKQVLKNIKLREHKVILLEVANEAWQNGFDGAQGIAELREFGQYLADRTNVLVALSDSDGGDNASILTLYKDSAADIATEHFSRDIRTSEGGWLPVRSSWDAARVAGIPPVCSNEPIGPGASVNSETDPIKLVSAAVFAWTAGLPMYVFHSGAGVYGDSRFEDMAGIGDYVHLRAMLPPDLPNWVRNDGKEQVAPFTVYCDRQTDRYWTDVSGATTGCHRCIGGIKGRDFVCYPQGILSGGLEIEARRELTLRVFNPITGIMLMDSVTKRTGERLVLPQGPGAYVIRGSYRTARPGVPNR